jgi:hypothetical protein
MPASLEAGERLTPTYAVKKGTRYRYYVSTSLITGAGSNRSNGLTWGTLPDFFRTVFTTARFPTKAIAILENTRRTPDLGAIAIKAAIERAGLESDEIGTAVMGNVEQAGTKMNPARQAAIHGGIPVTVPALTVNHVCRSEGQELQFSSGISQGEVLAPNTRTLKEASPNGL